MPRSNSGLTLIELLIAIAIAGILAAIAYPYYRNTLDSARVAKAQSIAGSFRSPLAEYHTLTGQWPPDELRNVSPLALQNIWVDISQAEFNSAYDYNRFRENIDGVWLCLIHVTWFGKDARKDTDSNSQTALGDDYIVVIAKYPCDAAFTLVEP